MSSLSQVLGDLQKSVISSETWLPKILLPTFQFTTCPTSSKVLCSYTSTHSCSIDVIQLLHQLRQPAPDHILTSFINQHLKYPDSGAAFEIHGYAGLQHSREVLDMVKTSSLDGGTCLAVIRSHGTTNKM